MLPVSVLALETALATSVSITIDVLAMANRICIAAGRQPAFDVRLVGPGAHLFRPFLAFPEAQHDAPELFIIPAQGLSKADDYARYPVWALYDYSPGSILGLCKRARRLRQMRENIPCADRRFRP